MSALLGIRPVLEKKWEVLTFFKHLRDSRKGNKIIIIQNISSKEKLKWSLKQR